MSRQYIRIARLTPLFLLVPVLWSAYSTYSTEAYLSSLSIKLNDFPPSYASALTAATTTNEHSFDFDYSVFPSNIANDNNTATSNERANTIPRLIHFIWFANLYDNAQPESLTPSAAADLKYHITHAPHRCALFNPNFTTTTWNASNADEFITTHYPSLLPLYTSYPHPIQRIDMLKYLLLAHFGGVYMDLDIACRRPLEPLLEFPAWFPKASPLGVNNDLMAARPGHPLLEYLVGRLESSKQGGWLGWASEWAEVFWSTGPRFASEGVAEWVDMHPEKRYVRGEKKDAVSDPDAFYILPEKFYSQDPGYTFFGHSPGGTWYGDDAKFVVWLLERPWVIAVVVGMPVALWAGLVLRRRRAVGWKAAKVTG